KPLSHTLTETHRHRHTDTHKTSLTHTHTNTHTYTHTLRHTHTHTHTHTHSCKTAGIFINQNHFYLLIETRNLTVKYTKINLAHSNSLDLAKYTSVLR